MGNDWHRVQSRRRRCFPSTKDAQSGFHSLEGIIPADVLRASERLRTTSLATRLLEMVGSLIAVQ